MTLYPRPPRPEDEPPPSAPVCQAEGCEEGTVLLNGGTPYECFAACPECEGTGTLEVGKCEACGQVRPDSEVGTDGICNTCFREMAERLKHEKQEPVVVLHPEVQWALSQTKWLEGAV